MNASPPTSAPAGPPVAPGGVDGELGRGRAGEEVDRGEPVLERLWAHPAAALDDEIAEERDVRRRPAEADDSDSSPRTSYGAERGHVAALPGGGSERGGLALSDGHHVLPLEQEEQRERTDGDEQRAAEVRDVEAVDERLRLVGGLRLATEPEQRVLGRARRRASRGSRARARRRSAATC